MTDAELNAIVEGVTIAVMAKVRAEFRDDIKELRDREPLVGPMGPAGPQGERGADGIDGRPGADSTVPGPEGPMGPRGERGPAGADGTNGRDGRDADPVDIEAIAVKAAALIPAPKDGQNGKDAEVDEALMAHLVAMHLEAAVSALPVPEKGKDGADGKSVTVEDVAPLIQAEVAKSIERIPAPRDGIGLVGALIDRDGHLIVTMSDGTTKDVGMVVGPDPDPQVIQDAVTRELASWPRPKDGEPGKDGTLEALGVKFVDYRTLQFFRKDSGDVVGTVSLTGLPRFCDVFKHDTEYQPGDIVKWGGSTWIAKNTGMGLVPGDKGLSQSMWALFSERGRQGKTGLTGQEGKVGPKGDKGDRGPERW